MLLGGGKNMDKNNKVVKFVKDNWMGFLIGILVGYLLMKYVFA